MATIYEQYLARMAAEKAAAEGQPPTGPGGMLRSGYNPDGTQRATGNPANTPVATSPPPSREFLAQEEMRLRYLMEQELKKQDWYNDPLWNQVRDTKQGGYAGNWTGGANGGIPVDQRYSPYNLLMQKYGTTNLNDYMRQRGIPVSGPTSQYGHFVDQAKTWLQNPTFGQAPSVTPVQPSGSSGGMMTEPAAPAPAPVAPSFPSANSASGLQTSGQSSQQGTGMMGTSNWMRPSNPVAGPYRTVQDSSAWRAVPRMLT